MKKFLPIIIPFLTVLTITIYVSTKIFKPGYIYFRDVTEGIEVDDLYKRYIFTFSDDIGESLAEKSRIPIFYSIFGVYSLGKFIGIFNDSDYVKVKILSLFILSLTVFILTTYKILKEIIDDKENPKNGVIMSSAASLGGVYYVSNFWFSNRIAHFGLFFSTVTIPVTFYLLYKYLFSKEIDFKRLIILLLSTAFLTGTPHTVLIQLVILFSLYVSFLLNKGFDKKNKVKKSVRLIIFGVIYLFLNAYWILPFLSSMSQPDAVLTETIVNAIGKNAYLSNSVRLTGYWLNSYQDYFVNIPQEIGSILSIFPLVLAFTALILLVKRKSIFFSILIILASGIFLSTSSDITNSFYFKLMFLSPIKSFGWLFREYDKIGILITYVYSLGIAIFLTKGSRRELLFVGNISLVLIILTMNIAFLNKTLVKNYTPQKVPNNFFEAIDILKQDGTISNTAWYPGVPQPNWAQEPEVRFWFSNLISTNKPAITISSEIMNFLTYLFNEENIYSINMGNALDRLGVKYLIIRRDYPYYFENDYEGKLLLQKSLKQIYTNNEVTIYENLDFTGLAKFYDKTVLTNQGLDIFKNTQNLGTDSLIIFADKDSDSKFTGPIIYENKTPTIDYAIRKYKDIFIYPYDYSTLKYDGTSGAWKIGSLENLNHAETDFFFSNVGLKIPQFDYERGVIIAKEGFEKISSYNKDVKEFEISFENEKGAKYDGSNLTFEIPTTPFDGPWNATKSSLFEVIGSKALEVKLNSYIPNELEPHFKITYFNTEKKIVKTLPMYPDRYRHIEAILIVPKDAYFAEFSVWSKNIFGPRDPLHVRNIKISDVTEIAAPVSMKIKAPNKCLSNCSIYARLLTSRIGGDVRFVINNNSFNVTTLRDYELEHSERYEWVKIGEIEKLGKSVDIEISNTDGFNSVNCLAILDEVQVVDMDIEMREIMASQSQTISSYTNKPILSIKKINPTKYEVEVTEATRNKGILVFSKPFSKNWVIGNQESKRVNGYANGWEIENLENATYVIEYRPQRFFYYGIAISLTTLIGIAIFFHYLKTKEVIASELKSKSQG